MRILHLAAGNRWTGAAAPAFAEVEALRAAGIEAHYAYIGGYKLEEKIGGFDFAHAAIRKRQNPVEFARTIRALQSLIDEHGIDLVHAHLTYDHLLASFLKQRRKGLRLARTFHSRRTLRSDPVTRAWIARADVLCVVNSTFTSAPALLGVAPAPSPAVALHHGNFAEGGDDAAPRPVFFTPPPLDHRQFTPDGPNARARYGIAPEAKLLAVIGKLAPGRGFELALETFAHVRRSEHNAKLMIIGHGPHRPALERHATSLGIASGVIWAGYHEIDLADHYRAADLLLFTAQGSDEGHRAVLEVLGCGVPPVTAPIPGMDALLHGYESELIAREGTPEAIADSALGVLRDSQKFRAPLAAHSQEFGYSAAARRLVEAYGQ